MANKIRAYSGQPWLRAILFIITFWAAGLLSRQVSFQMASFPTLWLPSGLFITVLLLSSVRHWTIYLIAALPAWLLYGLSTGLSPYTCLLLYFSSALEAVTGAWLMLQFKHGSIHSVDNDHSQNATIYNRPIHILNLVIFAAGLGSAINASITATVLAVLHPGFAFWPAWRITWISHGLGILVLTPLVLGLTQIKIKTLRRATPEQLIELVILVTGISICSLYVFVRMFGQSRQNYNYMVIPFLVWAALRFNVTGVAFSGLIVTLASNWGMIHHLEGFANSDTAIAMIMDSQGGFLGIVLVTCYILATVWMQGRSSQSALRESEKRYRLLVDNQGEGVSIVNQDEMFTFANPAAEQIFGVEPNTLSGRNVREFTTPQQFALILQQTEIRRTNKRSTYEMEIIQPMGQRRSLLVTATPQQDSNGQFSGTFAVFRDITERKQTEIALRDSRARLQTLFDHSPIPVWEEDFSRVKRLLDGLHRDGIEDFHEFFNQHPEQLQACEKLVRVLDVNQAVLQLFDCPSKEEFMAQIPSMMTRGPKDIFIEELIAIAEGRIEFEMEGPNDIIDGVIQHHSVRWTVAPGYEKNFRRVIVSIINITERKASEEQMRYLSTHDVLTGLYNRNFFEAEMERLQNSRLEPINVMVVDVNGMKMTNDTYGHAAGDDLLRRSAQVLKLSFRKEDVIARIGGDEFVVLFQGSIPVVDAVERVKNCLAEHNHWFDGLPLSLAIGAASGGRGNALVDLYKKADQQMYKEKSRSRRAKPESKDVKTENKAGNSPTSG